MKYEIEKILGFKTIYGKHYVIIKWKDFLTTNAGGVIMIYRNYLKEYLYIYIS